MKLAKGLRDVFRNHPFPPDEEGGIYAVLDESAIIVPIAESYAELVLGEGASPEIAYDYVGQWIIMTIFQEALFRDDPPESDWFETVLYDEETEFDPEASLKELSYATFYAPTVEAALSNHKRAVQMAQTL
jgi:hypothetical protein